MSKAFEDLPSVKHVFNKLKNTETTCIYQGIEFPVQNFKKAVADVKASKNTVIESIHSTLDARLDGASTIELESVAKVLNTEHWKSLAEDEIEFADDMVTDLLAKFHPILLKQGLCPNTCDLEILDEWHDMVSHTINFLQSSKANYNKTWRLLFDSSYSTKWKNILLLIQLLFSVPICNAKLERLFSKLRRTKNDERCSIGKERLTNVLRIVEEGPPLAYDSTPVVQMWLNKKVRRPNQKRRKKYKSRKKKVKYYHVSKNNTSLNVSVDDFNDVTDITPLSPTPESDNDGTTSTDSSDSSYAVVAASPNCIFSDTDSAASDFAGFSPEDF